jgi:hypothetical protein
LQIKFCDQLKKLSKKMTSCQIMHLMINQKTFTFLEKLQSPRTLAKLKDFWVIDHLQLIIRIKPLPQGNSHPRYGIICEDTFYVHSQPRERIQN